MRIAQTRPQSEARPRSRVLVVLIATLAATYGVALLLFGGVHPPTRAVLHGLLSLSLAIAACLPAAPLARSGRVLQLATAGALVLVAGCAGFLPLHSAFAWIVSPVWSVEHGLGPVGVATTNVELTLSGVSHVLLPVGFGVGVAICGVATGRRARIEAVILAVAVAVVLLAVFHVGAGESRLLGWIPHRDPTGRFFAPFVNPNHFGGFLALAFPLALSKSLSASSFERRAVHAVVAASIGLAAIWAGSGGALLVLGLQAAAVLVNAGHLHRGAALILLPPALAATVWWASVSGTSTTQSVSSRLRIWWDSRRLLADHWLLGSGLGTFGEAIVPYRSDHAFVMVDHAHNEWIEWATDTGVVGVGLLAAAALVIRPTAARGQSRTFRLTLGVCGVLMFAALDFPLQIPALAMGCAALLAWRVAVLQDRVPCSPGTVRTALAAMAVLQAGACAWQTRVVVVNTAAATLSDGVGPLAGAARTLGHLAPRRLELAAHRAAEAERASDPEGALGVARAMVAAHPGSATAHRMAAEILSRHGQREEAVRMGDIAVARGPADWRNWWVRAEAVARSNRDGAAAAWRDALLAGAPKSIERGWATLPVGLYWIAAVEDAPPSLQASTAAYVQRQGDVDAALLGYEHLIRQEPRLLVMPYVDALLTARRTPQARDYLEAQHRLRPDAVNVAVRLAEVEERLEHWEAASALWEALEDDVPAAALRSALVVEKTDGPARAIAMLDRHALVGRRLGPLGDMERARMLGLLDRGTECLAVLTASGLLEDPSYQRRAGMVASACKAGIALNTGSNP